MTLGLPVWLLVEREADQLPVETTISHIDSRIRPRTSACDLKT